MSTVLVLGGYGGFGARLVRRLAADGHDVLVAGRRLAKAEAFCAGMKRRHPLEADRDGNLASILDRHEPSLVIDAAGPFQGSGYGVPTACIAAGIPYLDLADGRRFVTGIGALDRDAREAGVAVISGASSVPALSGAVARHLTRGLDCVSAIDMAISASNRATAGRSVAAAILGTVGRPIRLWRGGRSHIAFGWQEMRRQHFALSQGPALKRRWVALADVPDLDLLPERVAGRPATTFRAGTELVFQNVALWLASWPVRWHWLSSLERLAGVLLPLQRLTARFGTDRSAMTVRAFGLKGPLRLERRWTLIASDGDGPEIPVMAAALLAGPILRGETPPGARDAGAALDLEDFLPAFAALSIAHETRDIVQPEPLYRRVMGDRFERLPPAVASLHSVLRDGGASGRAVVTKGHNPLARIVAAVMRFPSSGKHALHVAFEERGGVERWTRDFSGQRFTSCLSQCGSQVVERFGPLRFRFDLPSDTCGLRMEMRGWSVAGLPLPLALSPRTRAREWEEDGAFHFDVAIDMPLIGRVIRYHGWLHSKKPTDDGTANAPN